MPVRTRSVVIVAARPGARTPRAPERTAAPLLAVTAVLAVLSTAAAAAEPPPAGAAPALDGEGFAARFALVGQVQPRHSRTITDNPWSVGGETMDRGYSDYWKWREHLGRLGVKRVRIQSGWQRTDKGGGRYDFDWLAPVVEDMAAQGVRPWVCLCYGNESHEGGGTPRRDSPLPTGPARKAWLDYVRATVTRFKGKVRDYEIWNEPDLNARITADGYGRFAYETARVIRDVDPQAGVVLGAFADAVWQGGPGGVLTGSRAFARDALTTFAELGGRGLATAVSFHVYRANPDEVHRSTPSFRELIHSILPGVEVRQGESGAPSLNQQHYALRNMWWTEERQAKFLLRRMLGDWGRGIPTSVFSITEMHFPVAAETGLTFHGSDDGARPTADSAKHFKGLLETALYAPDSDEDDKTVVRSKVGYAAMQAVTAIFDSELKPAAAAVKVSGEGAGGAGVSAFAFTRRDGASALAVWRHGDVPGENPRHELVDVEVSGLSLGDDPRYVDLLTRAVYRTGGVVREEGGRTIVRGLPIYDSPVLVCDARLVRAR